MKEAVIDISGIHRLGPPPLSRRAAAKVAAGHGTAREVAKQADVFGADLIVAGGYGHSRMNEWVFGGVTRDLLSLRTHYVLLSH